MAAQASPSANIDPEKIAAFSKPITDLLDNGAPREASLRTLIGAIIVGDKSVKIVAESRQSGDPRQNQPPPKRSWFGTGMARPTRFERVTSTFGGWRSIQLSYGRIVIIAYAVLTRRSRENEVINTDLASPCFPTLF